MPERAAANDGAPGAGGIEIKSVVWGSASMPPKNASTRVRRSASSAPTQRTS